MREIRRSQRKKVPGMVPKIPPKQKASRKRSIVIESSSGDDEVSDRQEPKRKSVRKTVSSKEAGTRVKKSAPVVVQELVKRLETRMDRLKKEHDITLKEKDDQIRRLMTDLKKKDDELCKGNKRVRDLEAELRNWKKLTKSDQGKNSVKLSEENEEKSMTKAEKPVEKRKLRNRIAEITANKKVKEMEEDEEEEEEEQEKEDEGVDSFSVVEEKDVKNEREGDFKDVKNEREGDENKEEKKEEKEEERKEEEFEVTTDERVAKVTETEANKGRHEIRKVMMGSKLREETKLALREERERRDRVKIAREKHIIQQETIRNVQVTTRLALDVSDDNEIRIEVHKKLVRKLKPHQTEAVEFLWDSCMESLKQLKSGHEGSGCILAHCMGLGKTLSTIAFIHTLMKSKECGVGTVLIVCPLNTVLNWQTEWNKWLDKRDRVRVFEMASVKGAKERAAQLVKWHEGGGVIIMGYQLYRRLANYPGRSKRTKEAYDKCLMDPGPDLIICDEGHILKNDCSAISKAICKVKTKRRIVLTGTPLQNNLIEYHCMVNFVKPNLLGSRREFSNRFVNPITNGQHSDSTVHDVKVMKRRAHVLHEMLAGCVQRKDYADLTKLLPPKHEYVLSVRLSRLQIELYKKYLAENKSTSDEGQRLFADYQSLMRIWTHPWVLKLEEMRMEKQMILTESDDDELGSFYEMSDSDREEEIETEESKEDETEESEQPVELRRSSRRSCQLVSKDSDSTEDEDMMTEDEETDVRKAKVIAGEVIRSWQSRYRCKKAALDLEDDPYKQRINKAWWQDMLQEDHCKQIQLSGKLVLLKHILQMTKSLGEKLLVFSQSLLSLDLIELFLGHETENAKNDPSSNSSQWLKDEDYLRLDGSTLAHNRKRMIEAFNNPKNCRLCLLLISTKAGGLGINLEAANRVIIFDASWNPSHDVQSIFRVYRFGQERNVYVYRFLAQGTMEEKIYERQVTKETLSQRVIDEQQIDRHFSQADLQELYQFTPDSLDDRNCKPRPTPAVPKDLVLAELLTQHKQWIVGYHEHDSLLERRPEEDLSEEERKAAWEDYEREKNSFFINTVNARPFRTALTLPAPMPSGFNLQQFNQSLTGQQLPAPVQRIASVPSEFGNNSENGYNHHIAQLPKVVQEILKYNPTITADELKQRLQAFLGMHVSFPRGSIASGIGHIQGATSASVISDLTTSANDIVTNTQTPLPQPSVRPSAKPP